MSLFDNNIERKIEKLLPITMILLGLFFTFPKAGFYIKQDLPISFSYIWISIGLIFSFFTFIKLKSKPSVIFFLLVSLALGCAQLLINYIQHTETEQLLIIATVAIFSPIAGLILARIVYTNDKSFKLFKLTLIISLIIVLTYGIINFLACNFFHHPIGLPYITTTGSSVNDVFFKDNNRFDIIKAISTYNNGNIFGVCLLLWAPLVYNIFFKSSWLKTLCILCLVLTASRTVWIGLFITEALSLIILNKPTKKSLAKSIAQITLVFTAFFLCTQIYLHLKQQRIHTHQHSSTHQQTTHKTNNILSEFFLNPSSLLTMDGRINELKNIEKPNIFLSNTHKAIHPYSSLITYIYFIREYGYIGLLIFILQLAGPLAIKKPREKMEKVLYISIVTYLVMMLSDGAFSLIPTQVIYWFIVGLYLNFTNKTTMNNRTALKAKHDLPIAHHNLIP